MTDLRDTPIVVYDLLSMRQRLAEGYELVTWAHTMNDPWRFKMKLLVERTK